MDREPGGLQSMGSQRVRHDLVNRSITYRVKPFLSQSELFGVIVSLLYTAVLYSTHLCISQRDLLSLDPQSVSWTVVSAGVQEP